MGLQEEGAPDSGGGQGGSIDQAHWTTIFAPSFPPSLPPSLFLGVQVWGLILENSG